MTLFSSIPCVIILIAIAALNVLSNVFRGKLSLVLDLISIALHVVLAPIMLFSDCEISELALVYLFSAFVHILSVYVIKRVRRDKRDV